jgi:AcrR family transcriptional regulator
VGTLYRHFPTKEALLGALVVARLEPLVAAAEAAALASDPGEAFFDLVHHLAREFAGFRAVGDAIGRADIDVHRVKEGASSRLIDAFGVVMSRAQREGRVRPDITVKEVASMMGALCMSNLIVDEPSRFGRCVDLVCDGLRLPAASVSPSAPDR